MAKTAKITLEECIGLIPNKSVVWFGGSAYLFIALYPKEHPLHEKQIILRGSWSSETISIDISKCYLV